MNLTIKPYRLDFSPDIRHAFNRTQQFGNVDSLFQRLDNFLVIQAVSRRILQTLAVDQGYTAPRSGQPSEVWFSPSSMSGGTFSPNRPAMNQPTLEHLLFLFVKPLPDVVLPDSRNQAFIPIERFLYLDHVVGHQLCRRIDTRQATPDDDRGQVDLEIRQTVLLVSAR